MTIILNMYAYLDDAWLDITTYVSDSSPVRTEWGMGSNKPTDLLAKTGVLNFSLNNEGGLFTPHGTNSISLDWKKGTKVKAVFTFDGETYVRGFGTVDTIKIDSGTLGSRKVHVSVNDWMDRAIEYPIQNPAIALNQRADEAITTLLAGMPIQPQAVDLDIGSNTFPTVFNEATLKTRAYSEFQKLALSEFGYIYLKKDKVYGETLKFESASARSEDTPVKQVTISQTPVELLQEDGDTLLQEDGDTILTEGYTIQDVFLDNTMLVNGMNVVYGDNLINRITVSANPTRIATVDTPLFKLDSPLFVGAGETKSFFVQFTEDSSKRLVAALASDASYPTTLLHFDGAGSEELVVDEAGKPFDDIDATLITNIKRLGVSALFLDGTSSYVEGTTSDDYEFGSGDFFVEWYEYRFSATAGCATILRSGSSGYVPWALGVSDGTNSLIYITSNGSSWDIANGKSFGAITLSTWVHYSLGRTGNTFYARKNGVLTDTWTSSGIILASTDALTIGKYGTSYITAVIDEVRTIKGYNPHIYDFTPPTENYKLSGVIYGAWVNRNGTGSELTGDFTVDISYGAAGAFVTVENTGTTSGYLTTLRINGKIVETVSPVTDIQENADSIAAYDYSELSIDQPYQQDFTSGREKAASILDENKEPLIQINRVMFNANRDEAHTKYFLETDIGDLVRIKEDQTEINGYYFIQGMGWEATNGSDGGVIVNCWWNVKKFRDGLSPIAVEFNDAALFPTLNEVSFGYLPAVAVENTPYRVWSMWFNSEAMGQEGNFITTLALTSAADDIQGYRIRSRLNRQIEFYGVSDNLVQVWRSVALADTPNTDVHILMAYDTRSTLNQPLLFVNGVSNSMTFNTSLTTIRTGEVGTNLKINDSASDAYQLATFQDVRIYNGDQVANLSVLAAALYAEGAYGEANKTGLLFRTFYAPTSQLVQYEGERLTEDLKLVDDIGLAVGTPINTPLGVAI